MEGADGTNINTNPLIYTCEVRTRGGDDIKGNGGNQNWGGHTIIKLVTELKKNI